MASHDIWTDSRTQLHCALLIAFQSMDQICVFSAAVSWSTYSKGLSFTHINSSTGLKRKE